MVQASTQQTGIESLDRFLEHCHRKNYPAKSVIIYAEDKPDVLYYIVDGSVSVLIEDEEGREIVLAYLNKGDFFGEMGLFAEEEPRSAWVRARTACEVAEVSYAKFRQLYQEHPDVLFALAEQMGERLRQTSRIHLHRLVFIVQFFQRQRRYLVGNFLFPGTSLGNKHYAHHQTCHSQNHNNHRATLYQVHFYAPPLIVNAFGS